MKIYLIIPKWSVSIYFKQLVKVVFTISILLTGYSCISQKSSIKIDEWHQNSVLQIATGTKTPIVVGEINQSGNIILNLDEALLQEIKREHTAISEKFNSTHAKGMEMKTSTVADVFQICKDSIKFESPMQEIYPLARMGTFGIIDYSAKKPIGNLRFVSSKEFGEAYFNYDFKKIQPGYYLEWFYVDAPVSLMGTCQGPGYEYEPEKYVPTSTEYNLAFKPGWNLVKTEVLKVIEDVSGTIHPLDLLYQTLDEIPSDIHLLVRTK